MIIEETYQLLKSKYSGKFERLSVDEVKIGIFLTAVRLSDNSVGVSASTTDSYPFCAKANRDFGDYTPLKIKGKRVLDILETNKNLATISSLKNAILNAVSSNIISSGNYNILTDTDPIQILDLNSSKTITVVGAFQSYIRRISETDNRLFVLELREGSLLPEHKNFFVPASDYNKILPESDIVIITGQTLVNKTIDDLLSVIPERTQVVLTGPSSSLVPDVLFKNKVSIIGSIMITNPELLFDIVSEGGTGYHLFEYCARKICILKSDERRDK